MRKKFIDRPERAQRLMAARIHAGFKYAAHAAKKHGWAVSSYGQHETGRTDFKDWYEIYAKAFKVDPLWLWSGKGRGPNDKKEITIPDRTMEKLKILDPDMVADVFEYFDSIVDTAVQRSTK